MKNKTLIARVFVAVVLGVMLFFVTLNPAPVRPLPPLPEEVRPLFDELVKDEPANRERALDDWAHHRWSQQDAFGAMEADRVNAVARDKQRSQQDLVSGDRRRPASEVGGTRRCRNAASDDRPLEAEATRLIEHAVSSIARWFADPRWRMCFFVALAAIAAAPWLVTAGSFNEFRDSQVMWLYEDQARRSVLDFGQLPLWNPEFCGGLPALGTPQARFGSPMFLFSLIFGTTRAEPLLVFTMVLVALYGAYRLARSHGATPSGATLGAPLFGLLGIFACAPFLGWFGFLGFALLPWVLLGIRRAAAGKPSGLALVGLSTAFIVGFGGTYVAPISLVACAAEVLLLVVRRRGKLAWAQLTAAGLLALGLSAFRLWPVWEELQRGPRVIAGISNVGVQLMGASLFGTVEWWTAEVWYLVTIPGAIVAGLALLRWRGRWLGLSLALWLWISAGNATTPSLYALLRSIPVFSLLRNSERFLACAGLVMAIGVSFAISDVLARVRLQRKVSPRSALVNRALAIIALLGVTISTVWQLHNFTVAASKRTLKAPPRELVRPFHQARGNRWAVAGFGPMSRGSLACWEAYGVPQSPKLRGDLEHEAWLSDATAGSLEETHWSPNALGFHARTDRPTRIVINQNYHRGWKTDVGTVVNDDGLLAVELPPGDAKVTLCFLPRSAIGGLIVSALALLALSLISLSKLGSARQLLLSVLPLAVGLALAFTNSEPPFTRPEPTGPDGETIIAADLPLDVKKLGVQFAEGVKLEGGAITYRPQDDRIRIELDWSRSADANKRLGIFLHLEPGTLKRVPADHLQVSDAIFLEQIPVGSIGRDILLVDIPESKRGPAWNAWVGLWEMRGDGHRLEILNANGVQNGENRALVGSLELPKLEDAATPQP
ncbi:MAG: hypothetical protein QM817_11095 [Archangium sp.]